MFPLLSQVTLAGYIPQFPIEKYSCIISCREHLLFRLPTKTENLQKKKVPEKPSFKTNSNQSGLESRVNFFEGGFSCVETDKRFQRK